MKRILIYIAIVCALAGVVWAQHAKIDRLTGERDRYRENTDVLLGDVQTYRTRDSLSAAKVGALELRLSEVERYRAADKTRPFFCAAFRAAVRHRTPSVSAGPHLHCHSSTFPNHTANVRIHPDLHSFLSPFLFIYQNPTISTKLRPSGILLCE